MIVISRFLGFDLDRWRWLSCLVVAIFVKRGLNKSFIEVLEYVHPIIPVGDHVVQYSWIPFICRCQNHVWKCLPFFVGMWHHL